MYDKILQAHKCLKRPRCRDQYTRYNLSIDLPDDPNVEIDWRLGFSILFYMLFAFTQSVLGSQEQKPGTRVGMGVGIMFCIDEVLILQDVSAFIKEGQKSDPSVQRILSLFPQSYCTFEVIILARIVYFLLFNLVCSASLTYVLNDENERVRLSQLMEKNMIKLGIISDKIYKAHEGKDPEFKNELLKKPYKVLKDNALKEMQIEIESLKKGQSID
jgi:hypothetical protein